MDLARGMVENFFYEIENYGAVLNANRTYFLTRSQPPLLSSMIRAVYDAEIARDPSPANLARQKQWLARAYSYARRDHDFWLSASTAPEKPAWPGISISARGRCPISPTTATTTST